MLSEVSSLVNFAPRRRRGQAPCSPACKSAQKEPTLFRSSRLTVCAASSRAARLDGFGDPFQRFGCYVDAWNPGFSQRFAAIPCDTTPTLRYENTSKWRKWRGYSCWIRDTLDLKAAGSNPAPKSKSSRDNSYWCSVPPGALCSPHSTSTPHQPSKRPLRKAGAFAFGAAGAGYATISKYVVPPPSPCGRRLVPPRSVILEPTDGFDAGRACRSRCPHLSIHVSCASDRE